MLGFVAKLPLWQKIAGSALLVAAAALAFQWWLAGQRSDAVAADRNAGRAQVSEAARAGLETAMDEESAREAAFREKQMQDRKEIEDAKRNGSSPFDGLFPAR